MPRRARPALQGNDTMSTPAYSDIIRDGLWSNNSGLVQLLGLCPLLAVTTTVVNGLGLGLATTLTLLSSNAIVSLIRNLVRLEEDTPFSSIVGFRPNEIDPKISSFTSMTVSCSGTANRITWRSPASSRACRSPGASVRHRPM